MVGRCCRVAPWHLVLTLIKPMSFFTRKLAYVIDSLVRVSRRVSRSRFGKSVSLRRFVWKHVLLRPALTLIPVSWAQSCLLTVKSQQVYILYAWAFGGALHVWTLTRCLLHSQVIHFYHFLLNDFKSFNPLFKVLFIFPSQYLFAIGFPSIFSLRRSLSPI